MRRGYGVMISEAEVLTTLATNPWTGLFFDESGSIVELLPLNDIPSKDLVLKLTEKHWGQVFRFVAKGLYGPTEMSRWSKEAVEGLEMAKQGKLRPGANCF